MAADTLYIRLDFDEPISEADKARFVGLVAEEMEFGDLREHRYHKTGWGMHKARVIKVARYMPKRDPHPGRNSNLLLRVSGVDAAIFPEDPVRGRFVLRGKIVGGLKSAIGRTVEGRLTAARARSIRDDIDRWLSQNPNTGTTPEREAEEVE